MRKISGMTERRHYEAHSVGATQSPSLRGMPEAIQKKTRLLRAYLAMTREWIASSLTLLAMTVGSLSSSILFSPS